MNRSCRGKGGDGIVLGTHTKGIEYAWRNFIFGVEYNYIDLGTQHYGGEVKPNTTWPLDYNLRATFNSVVGRVSYKFN